MVDSRCNSGPQPLSERTDDPMATRSHTRPDEKDEWRTPPFVFWWAHQRFNFAVDLASTEANKLCHQNITKHENALAQDWSRFAGAGWCNPPYSNIDPWLQKAWDEAYEGFTSVFLIPTPNGEDRYSRWVLGHASEVIFIGGRLAFINAEGKPVSGNTRGSCLVVYRGLDLRHTRYRHVLRDAMLEEWEAQCA